MPIDRVFTQSPDKMANTGQVLHEIAILYKLITDMNETIDELKKRNIKQENEISVLTKVVIQYDNCHADLTIKLEQTRQKINYAQDNVDYLSLRVEDIVAQVDGHDTLIDELSNGDCEHDNEEIKNDTSLLTKKQRISHKKHERRKSKRIAKRIATAQEYWVKQNGGYNIGGMQFI